MTPPLEENVSVVVPAYNEEERLSRVLRSLVDNYFEVIVVDDGSEDNTYYKAKRSGARVLRNRRNQGYLYSIKRGMNRASSDVIVTFDADGEHRAEDIDKVARPVVQGEADLVLGSRQIIPRLSERLISWLANLQVDVKDTGTGLRALSKELARSLNLDTSCTCGTLVLETYMKGYKIEEIEIEVNNIDKPKGIAWNHFIQIFHLIRYLILNEFNKWNQNKKEEG